ncbi:STAS domain-containing protein [bacterium]|nr:STAS domain-containing protein [bacterium]
MEVSIRDEDHIKIIAVKGEVDLYSSPIFREKLLAVTSANHKAILVDLEQVIYMDSSGIATLVEALQAVGKYGGKLKIANLRDAVRDVFELSRLDRVFDISPTLEEAKQSFN